MSKTQQDHFLRTLFECIITSRIELEAEYVALLFTIDDMQHPLFRGIPAPEMDEAGHYQLTRAELVERRLSYLERTCPDILYRSVIFTNIQTCWEMLNTVSPWTRDLTPLLQSAINSMSDIL